MAVGQRESSRWARGRRWRLAVARSEDAVIADHVKARRRNQDNESGEKDVRRDGGVLLRMALVCILRYLAMSGDYEPFSNPSISTRIRHLLRQVWAEPTSRQPVLPYLSTCLQPRRTPSISSDADRIIRPSALTGVPSGPRRRAIVSEPRANSPSPRSSGLGPEFFRPRGVRDLNSAPNELHRRLPELHMRRRDSISKVRDLSNRVPDLTKKVPDPTMTFQNPALTRIHSEFECASMFCSNSRRLLLRPTRRHIRRFGG